MKCPRLDRQKSYAFDVDSNIILEAASTRGSFSAVLHAPIPIMKLDVGAGLNAMYGHCDGE